MEEWKRKSLEAFARKNDYACGMCLESWLIDEKEEA